MSVFILNSKLCHTKLTKQPSLTLWIFKKIYEKSGCAMWLAFQQQICKCNKSTSWLTRYETLKKLTTGKIYSSHSIQNENKFWHLVKIKCQNQRSKYNDGQKWMMLLIFYNSVFHCDIQCYSLQSSVSSDPSEQSGVPSQRQVDGMQSELLHLNWSGRQKYAGKVCKTRHFLSAIL